MGQAKEVSFDERLEAVRVAELHLTEVSALWCNAKAGRTKNLVQLDQDMTEASKLYRNALNALEATRKRLAKKNND